MFYKLVSVIAILSITTITAVSQENQFSFQPNLSLSIGNLFAVDGNHGATNFGIYIGQPVNNFEIELEYSNATESYTGDIYSDPLEYYRYYEAIIGYKYIIDKFILTTGLGGGYMRGLYRTGFLYSDSTCVATSIDPLVDLFTCPEKKLDQHYNSQIFSTDYLDPYLQIDFQIFKYFGISTKLHSLINKDQGLGEVAFMMYLGNKISGKIK